MNHVTILFQIMKTGKSGSERENEVRRIQVTGRGSYVVSLPKGWVKQARLKRGGRVEFVEQPGVGLLVVPITESKVEGDQPRCEILISPDATADSVARKIISLYVVGFFTIVLTSDSENLSASVRDVIRYVARRKLVGVELVNESSKSATLQVLLDLPQLLVPDVLRRMSSIMTSMLQDAIHSLTIPDPELANQVLKIDDEMDRFSLYIIRQLKWAVQHPLLLGRIGLTAPVECLGYRIITKGVERSADHAARVAKNSMLIGHRMSSTVLKDINTLSGMASRMMQTAIDSLFVGDYELAESVLLDREKISSLEAKLVDHLLKEKMPASELSALRLISESLRRIGEYATDISEVVLNLTVKKSIEAPSAGPRHTRRQLSA